LRRTRLYLFIVALCIPTVVCGWWFDDGLETYIGNIRQLFKEKKLYLLYMQHVDPRLKLELAHYVQKMKEDQGHARQIARRLHFKSYSAFKNADSSEVIQHFYYTMLHPPEKKQRTIANTYYLHLSLALSLLVAPFDSEMDIADHYVQNNHASILCKSGKIMVNAYFIKRRGQWYITSEKLSRKG
jgi:hypothetical protein